MPVASPQASQPYVDYPRAADGRARYLMPLQFRRQVVGSRSVL